MKILVRLGVRPSRDGRSFTYYLDYPDENGKRRRISLGHSDERKAERQREQKEKELRMGLTDLVSMRLSTFLKDSIKRTRGQVRDSSLREAQLAMNDFINCIRNIDYRDVRHCHGEQFLQYCFDKGNTPATAAKKLRHLKRLFQLARERGQLDENPLRWVKQPKSAKKKVHIFTEQHCSGLLKAARQYQDEKPYIEWELLIRMALCTAMRRGELLNLTWPDIDFDRKTAEVSPKDDTESTWEWHIKDADSRTLPLTEDVMASLVKLRSHLPESYPYVFVPPKRYMHIQKLRQEGNWTVEKGRCPFNNFTRLFNAICLMAGIKHGSFHDLRRTCLSKWLSSGLSEFQVMTLAGHSKFETTRKFYLAVNDDLVDQARAISEGPPKPNLVTHLSRTPLEGPKSKRPPSISA